MPLSIEVLTFLQTIPKGKVTTYQTLAKHFSTHPRSIASILKHNTEQDVFPCYRVIHSDGRIGGYNLGVEEKINRLEQDGIRIENGKVVAWFFMDVSTI